MAYRILVINPGSTSTKVAVYDDESVVFERTLRHSMADLAGYPRVGDQRRFRCDAVQGCLKEQGVTTDSLSAVVGRGGILRPLASGTYRVNGAMLADLTDPATLEHASNLGAPLADEIAASVGVPAFIVDPVAVDEFDDVARLTGLPELERRSLSHALNVKAVARRAARDLGARYEDLNLVVVHLGSGISVTAHRRGRMVDVNNATDAGPFSPERAGTLPLAAFVDLCYSGRYTAEAMKRLIVHEAGLAAYFGTRETQDVERLITAGDAKA
ncbi:MAG: butyrate kinase, partial [Dehalococcoidales bacterium]|nr:butyrate kinase [Dehalococcoidales bacterium]